jgi:hypothetical protein
MANLLQSVSFTHVSPLPIVSKQSNGCKLNFLNTIRGAVNLDVKGGHALQTNQKLVVFRVSGFFHRCPL